VAGGLVAPNVLRSVAVVGSPTSSKVFDTFDRHPHS